jgi:hypothetical protein
LSTADVAYLLSPRAVREQGHAMLALAEAGKLASFAVDGDRLDDVVGRVLATIRTHYPDVGRIPPHSRWRHFDVGGIDRAGQLETRLAGLPADLALRARLDLVVTSVLLDAGAGPTWRFHEPGSGLSFGRSEGLAVASFHMFMAGGFSSAPDTPLRADAAGLEGVTEASLARFFQVTDENPMVGLAGRVALLQRLGGVMRSSPHLAELLREKASGGILPAADILAAVLAVLGPIWPGRQSMAGVNLGDTWPHPQLGLVPLHKLSQWLSYSLLEPLEAAGIKVVTLDALTGLAEYRNGGLFLDTGLLVPKTPDLLVATHDIGSPAVVEWRALTVALLDRVAGELRRRLGLDATTLPLAKVLEGGTWRAGRAIAAERRSDAGPPLRVRSDGTVF